MGLNETITKLFDRSNIAEMPNPKAIHVERVAVTTPGQDGKNGTSVEFGFIRNSNLHPDALTERG
jgi:hypothetical protein